MSLTNTQSVLPSTHSIGDMLSHVVEIIDHDLSKEFLAAESADVVEFARAFVALRQLKDKIEAVDKAFSKLFENAKNERMPNKFEESGVPSVNLDEGFRVTISHQVRASTKADQKDNAIAWLEANQLGSIVNKTVNSSTLSAVARTMIEDGKELPEDLFAVHVLNSTSVTKTK